jgi:hypothetical protein
MDFNKMKREILSRISNMTIPAWLTFDGLSSSRGLTLEHRQLIVDEQSEEASTAQTFTPTKQAKATSTTPDREVAKLEKVDKSQPASKSASEEEKLRWVIEKVPKCKTPLILIKTCEDFGFSHEVASRVFNTATCWHCTYTQAAELIYNVDSAQSKTQ